MNFFVFQMFFEITEKVYHHRINKNKSYLKKYLSLFLIKIFKT